MSNREVGGSKPLNWKLIGGVTAAVLALLFILQNTEKGNIDFLFWSWNVGVWFALLITLLLGVVIGWLGSRFLFTKKS